MRGDLPVTENLWTEGHPPSWARLHFPEKSVSVWEGGARGCGSRGPVPFWAQLEASYSGKEGQSDTSVEATAWKPNALGRWTSRPTERDNRASGPSDKTSETRRGDRLGKGGREQKEGACELPPRWSWRKHVVARVKSEWNGNISRNMSQWFVTGRKDWCWLYDGTEILPPSHPPLSERHLETLALNKRKPKKKWKVTAGENILSVKSWVQLWAPLPRMHSLWHSQQYQRCIH